MRHIVIDCTKAIADSTGRTYKLFVSGKDAEFLAENAEDLFNSIYGGVIVSDIEDGIK